MNPQRRVARWGGALLATATIAGPAHAQAPAIDTAAAVQAVRDFGAACARDGGRLWGRSLCGPLVVVHPATRFAVATDSPPGGAFARHGDVWLGAIPAGIPLANTSLRWAEREWAMALLPLGDSRFARLQLVGHEAFHRVEDSIGLGGPDRLNPHLDERDGRWWLRLELRALAAALVAAGDDARSAARDAMLFRAARRATYPGADTLESALELAEGLPEYTGYRLAGDLLGDPTSAAAAATLAFERRPSYARALGYGTGPALGLLLDRWLPDWRARVPASDPATLLAEAIGFTPPADPARDAAVRAERYGGAELASAEDVRAAARARRLDAYRARLVLGPVLVLEQERLMRSFDPNTLVPFPGGGTIYPTGTFSAPWGSLQVDSGGALVADDFRTLTLQAPAAADGPVVRGPGWTLELAEGWVLRARDGRMRAVKREE